MKKSFMLVLAGGVLLCAGATAQTSGNVDYTGDAGASSYRYTSDYKLASWSREERMRPAPRNRNALQTDDELLGGPVPEVERHKVRASRSEDLRVVMTDATRANVNAGTSRRLPGRQAESRYGRLLGRIAVVERNNAGDISAVWVQPPYEPDGELESVPVQSLSLRNGRVVIATP